MNGWRTVAIESPMQLSERDNCLVCFDPETKAESIVPLAQLREIMVMHRKTSLTSGLMAACAVNGIQIVFCDRKYQPVGILLSLDQHNETAGMLMAQARWDDGRKDDIWALIVRDKIRMQTMLLSMLGKSVPRELPALYGMVNSGDGLNCEGYAAKLYFPALFGDGFVRREASDINAGLNYGYSIILSCMSRIIVSYGHTPALGIHHCNRENRLNLACDLMEPFRPFVDLLVYENGGGELDMNLRKKLIGVLNMGCVYKNMRTTVETAMNCYALDVFKALVDATRQIGEIDFER